MSNLEHIKFKLQKFIIKFYLNELIRGTILFFTIGLLYLFFTVFIEFNFWLKPFARFVLFGVFILVEVILLFFYILLPIFKIPLSFFIDPNESIIEYERIEKLLPKLNPKLPIEEILTLE